MGKALNAATSLLEITTGLSLIFPFPEQQMLCRPGLLLFLSHRTVVRAEGLPAVTTIREEAWAFHVEMS